MAFSEVLAERIRISGPPIFPRFSDLAWSVLGVGHTRLRGEGMRTWAFALSLVCAWKTNPRSS